MKRRYHAVCRKIAVCLAVAAGFVYTVAADCAYIVCKNPENTVLFPCPCGDVFAEHYPGVCTLVSDRLLKPLETYYAQPELSALRNADAIVVLGGGSVGGVRDFDGEGQAAADPANRLLMGIRLHRALNLPILVSGGQVFSYAGTEAEIEYRLLKSAGIGEAFILKEDRSRNTVENARYTKQLCEKMGMDKVILVTSGYHLPRSVLIFEREGVPVIPYPTDYKTNQEIAIDAFSFTPSAEAVRTSAIAMKEYLGILAVKLGAQ